MGPRPPVTSSVAYKCPRLLRQSNLVLSVLGGYRIPRTSWDPPFMSLSHNSLTQLPILSGESLGVPQTQAAIQSGGSLGHPGILRWCPLRHRPPSCPEDPLTSQDPPFVSPQTQAPMLFRGSLGHPGILPWCPLRHRPPSCLEDPLDIPGSSLGVLSDTGPVLSRGSFLHVSSDTGPHAVWRIPGSQACQRFQFKTL